MTPPDSVGKDERGCVRHECKRVRMEMQAELTRLQALDRQRQEECEALRASVEQLREQVRFNGKAMDAVANSMREVGCTFDSNRTPIICNDRAEAAEAALAEARGLLQQVETFTAYANCDTCCEMNALARAFLTRTAKEPNNA